MKKKIISLILAVSVIFSVIIIPAQASTVTNPSEQKLYTVLDKVVNTLVGGIAALIKTPYSWTTKDKFVSENFLPGNSADEFLDEPSEDAAWYVGYSNASLLTGNEVGGGDYYVGGSLSVTKKLATAQYDDQKVRTIAISDGRGISIFAVLDAYGFANSNVRELRAQFMEWANKQNLDITSVNISVLHQHSCVDTFGMNGDIVAALFLSSVRSLFGMKLPSGQNEDYMDNLYTVTLNSMKNAVNDMQKGTLYYGSVDVKEYIYDKRDPQVYETNLNRLRFVPDSEGAKETWIVNGAIHCVGNGAAGTALTGDYPYYMEKYINENDNANFFYIQGAELAITNESNDITPDPALIEEYGDRYATLTVYGKTLAQKLETITADNETVVEPIFNIAFREIWLDIDNNILVLAAKGGLLINNVVKNGIGKYSILTEIGYCEIGKNIAVSIIPGELAPEIAFGGADTAETSWYGEDWKYPSFAEMAKDKKLLVFGLTNDQVGYILTDNNWHSYFTENEEIVSTGRYAGVTITNEYINLYNEYNK